MVRYKRVRFWVSLVLVALMAHVGFGQTMYFDRFLEQSADINSIVKDDEGFLWVASRQGLYRYDGYTFKHIANSRPEAPITSIVASGNQLFLGHLGAGFGVYDKAKEQFDYSYAHVDSANRSGKDSVLVMRISNNGILWLGTKAGLRQFDPTTRQERFFEPYKDYACKAVTGIAEDGEGNLWLYGPCFQLCKFDPSKSLSMFPGLGQKGQGMGESNPALMLDRDGYLWFGDDRGELWRYHIASQKTLPIQIADDEPLPFAVTSLMQDAEGKVWIGKLGVGLFVYYPDLKMALSAKSAANLSHNLTGSEATTFCESHPGVVWVGTEESGLYVWKKGRRLLGKYATNDVPHQGLNTQSVLTIVPAKKGKIWLGTDGGGLNLYDPKSKRFDYFTSQNSVLCNNSVKSVFEDTLSGDMWVGVYQHAVCKLNFKQNKVQFFPDEIYKNIKRDEFNCGWSMCKTSQGQLWIGLVRGGVRIFDDKKGDFVDLPYISDEFQKIISSRIYRIMEDHQKRIWIGTESYGAICYEPTNRTYKRFGIGQNGGLTSNYVKTIYQDSKNTIWIGCQNGGLAKMLSFEEGKFEVYSENEGLPINNVKSIIEDDNGNLWMGTDNGASCFHVKEKFFVNFDLGDNIQGLNYHSNSIYKDPNGYIYMGGSQGLNIFHPDSLNFNATPPVVRITDIKLFDKTLHPNKKLEGRILLTQTASKTTELVLSYEDNILSIEFAALDFLSPQKNKYAYRLMGYNDVYTYVNSDKRTATYINLPPGEYVFQVIASNNDGVWNKTGASLNIVVKPPLHQIWWVRLLLVVFVIAAISFYFYFRNKNILRQNRLLEEMVEERTRELQHINKEMAVKNLEIQKQKDALVATGETKDKIFSIIAHDLKNPIVSLDYLVKSYALAKCENEEEEEMEAIFTHISKSVERLNVLVASLLEWSKSQKEGFVLDKVPIRVKAALEETVGLLEGQANIKNISIDCVVQDGLVLLGDQNMVQTVLRNLLSNCIKFTNTGGWVKIKAERIGNQVQITFQDNGVGMSENVIKKLFEKGHVTSSQGTNAEAGTGLGLMIVLDFIKKHNGQLQVESEEGKGSMFRLLFPTGGV
jgi:signal transduction histidine kinase/ligand-binding sensor domain-containing protein